MADQTFFLINFYQFQSIWIREAKFLWNRVIFSDGHEKSGCEADEATDIH